MLTHSFKITELKSLPEPLKYLIAVKIVSTDGDVNKSPITAPVSMFFPTNPKKITVNCHKCTLDKQSENNSKRPHLPPHPQHFNPLNPGYGDNDFKKSITLPVHVFWIINIKSQRTAYLKSRIESSYIIY